jgi:TolA-binding protein
MSSQPAPQYQAIATQVAAVEAALTGLKEAHGIELRDLKQEIDDLHEEVRNLNKALATSQIEMAPLLAASARFVQLVAEADEARGRDKLIGKLASGGILTAIGAAIYGIFEFFAKGGS